MKKIITLICGLLLSLSIQAAETKITYYVPDAQGSPIAALDEQGNILWRKHYKPFGEEIETTEVDNRIGYTGHVQDRDTGLTYMGARYYDPAVPRFMSMDPSPVNPDDPRTFNRYNYANNNPYRFVDPDGRWAEDIVLGVPSLAIGVDSFLNNVGDGNYLSAAMDAGGIVADGAAILAPGIPGCAGLGIKVIREGGEKVAKGAENALEKTPKTSPEIYKNVRGCKGKCNTETGEIWEKDLLHKEQPHYEVYKDKKAYDKGKRDRAVWEDGRPKEEFKK